MRIMVFMKNFGITWGGLLRAAAVIIAMLLVPVTASAHITGDCLVPAGGCAEAGQDATAVVEFGCFTPATGHHIHVHLAFVPPMEAGPTQSPDEDPLVTAAPAMITPAPRNLGTHSAPESRIPIAAPPRFILFGNFRS